MKHEKKKMKLSALIAAATMTTGFALVGCDEGASTDVEESQRQAENNADSVDANLSEARSAIDRYVANTRDSLDRLDTRYDQLKPKVDNMPVQVQDKINTAMAEYQRAHDDLTRTLDEIEDASVDQWKALQAKADDAIDTLQDKYDEILAMLENELGSIQGQNS